MRSAGVAVQDAVRDLGVDSAPGKRRRISILRQRQGKARKRIRKSSGLPFAVRQRLLYAKAAVEQFHSLSDFSLRCREWQ